jgi:hypothetical protein
LEAVQSAQIQNDCGVGAEQRRHVVAVVKAAKASVASAIRAQTIGSEFIETAYAAPITIVNITNKINNSVNGALIATQKDIQTLASNLKGVIPTSATSLAGAADSLKTDASSAQKPTAKSTTKAKRVSFSPSEVNKVGDLGVKIEGNVPVSIRKEISEFDTQVKSQQSAPLATVVKVEKKIHEQHETAPVFRAYDLLLQQKIEEQPLTLMAPEDPRVAALKDDIAEVNAAVVQVAMVVGSASATPDNSKCPSLAKKAGPPAVTEVTLRPEGDIVLLQGEKTSISISGGTSPYIQPLFAQDAHTAAVTGTLRENSIDISTTSEVAMGSYPFFVGDGANGKPLNVLVIKGKPKDIDEPAKCGRRTN